MHANTEQSGPPEVFGNMMSTRGHDLVSLCTLESVSPVLFSYFNADSGNLQHSPTGASGQAAIERPQGIITVLQFFGQLI